MSVHVAVPTAIIDALRALTDADHIGPPEATTGGFSNLSFFTTLDDTPVVVKAARSERKRADLRREASVIRRLDGLTATNAMPWLAMLLAHGDDGDVTLTVLERVEGQHGIVAVQAGEVDVVVARAAVLGRVLRTVHSLAPHPDPDPMSQLASRFAGLDEAIDALDLAPDLAEPMRACINAAVHRRGVAFVHGDFGFHNTLWAPASTGGERLSALLDWEFAGWGNPLTDVAWLWWSLRFRNVDGRAWQAFTEAYSPAALRAIGFDATALDVLIRAQMVSLLLRTDPGTEVREVWLERWRQLPQLGTPAL
jgi:aminoglycoside phosphotransferase (APT) family kinase protein